MAGDCLQGTNMFAYCLNNPVMYVDPSGRSSNETINSSTQLAIDITKIIVGLYLFDTICKSFNVDGVAILEGTLGKIVDMEYEIYEFEVSDDFNIFNAYSTELSVSAAIETFMLKVFSKISSSPIVNFVISATMSFTVQTLLKGMELLPGKYVLVHFSFLELREEWPVGDFWVHDFFFLYFQSNEKDYVGNLLDESLSPYNFWYSFMDM